MKRLIVAAVLLIAVLAACIVTNNAVNRNTAYLIGLLDRIEEAYTAGSREDCAALTDQFVMEFHEKTRWFPFFMRHADISKIEETAAHCHPPCGMRATTILPPSLSAAQSAGKLAELEQPTPENIL